MHMKRWRTAICTLLLTCCLGSAAADAMFATTQAFLDAVSASGVQCELQDMRGDGEHVAAEVATKDGRPVTIDLCFNAEGRLCSLRAMKLITFEEYRLQSVLEVCNELNSDYRYVRFFVDESECTVTAALDVRFLPNEAAEVAQDAMQRLLTIVGECLPFLSPMNVR